MQHIPILAPLGAGAIVFAATVFVHAVPLSATVNFVRRERQLGRVGQRFWIDLTIVGRGIFYALLAHLAEIALWAGLFVMLGEFHEFGAAYYHSAVNYTTLGYGDVIMSPSWRLLGPMEAATGMLMFGVSTAMIFAIIERLVEARFVDLKD
ncbi:MAG TPA: ion channel [Verrucomicrobiae bacterium]|nr:ion channel [Verrucomicrobiae bacterium]